MWACQTPTSELLAQRRWLPRKITLYAVVWPAASSSSTFPAPPRPTPSSRLRPMALCLEPVQSPREGQSAGVGLGVSVFMPPTPPPPWLSDFLDWVQFPGRAETCQAFSRTKPSGRRAVGMAGLMLCQWCSMTSMLSDMPAREAGVSHGSTSGPDSRRSEVGHSVCGCPKRGLHASPSQTLGIKNK